MDLKRDRVVCGFNFSRKKLPGKYPITYIVIWPLEHLSLIFYFIKIVLNHINSVYMIADLIQWNLVSVLICKITFDIHILLLNHILYEYICLLCFKF